VRTARLPRTELADELANLVLAGKKSATCWAAAQGLLTQVGKRMVMLDGAGRARAVIETVELTRRHFAEVDSAFAFDEGEGDRTLAYWHKPMRPTSRDWGTSRCRTNRPRTLQMRGW
jgi:uncharacterized protein YhfF